MADQNTSLPMRTETAGDVAVKIVDHTNPTTQRMIVDSDSNAHVEVHGNDPAGVDRVLKLSEGGHANVDGVYNASTNTDPANIGIITHTRNATPGDAQQGLRVTGIQNSTVIAMDVAIRDEAGAVYSSSNPLHVQIAESEGTEVQDYNTAATIAAAASSNHDYTVAGPFLLSQILASASGKMKIELQIDADGAGAGGFVSKAVAFNSTANPNIDIKFERPLVLASGAIIRVIRTNKDLLSQDVYSTVVGLQT